MEGGDLRAAATTASSRRRQRRRVEPAAGWSGLSESSGGQLATRDRSGQRRRGGSHIATWPLTTLVPCGCSTAVPRDTAPAPLTTSRRARNRKLPAERPYGAAGHVKSRPAVGRVGGLAMAGFESRIDGIARTPWPSGDVDVQAQQPGSGTDLFDGHAARHRHPPAPPPEPVS
jgi:hypothetical protein